MVKSISGSLQMAACNLFIVWALNRAVLDLDAVFILLTYFLFAIVSCGVLTWFKRKERFLE